MNTKKRLLNTYLFLTGILCFVCTLSCSKDKSFEILFYSNLNGNIEACDCYETMLGGLHQIKPVVDKLREENPDLIVIDGGDTFNTYSFIELDQAIFDAYKIIKPDIWVPGEQEFIEGEEFFRALTDHFNSSFLTGNININNRTILSKKEYVFQDKKIVITSFIQPDVFMGADPMPDITIKNDNLLKNITPEFFNILIFHGNEKEMDKQKDLIQGFDLVLTSHEQSGIIDLQGEIPIIDGGSDGEFLVHIILQENDSGFKISASKINIEQSDTPNQEIAKIISDYRNKVGFTD